jgi:hypothetical protein
LGRLQRALPIFDSQAFRSNAGKIISIIHGVAVIALGFSVLWKKPTAAWVLFGLAILDMVSHVIRGAIGY